MFLIPGMVFLMEATRRRIVNAIIEIPQGARAKYEIDKASGLLKLDRVIYSSFYYPVNYGFHSTDLWRRQ